MHKKINFLVMFFLAFLLLSNCVKFNPVSSRDTPVQSQERAKKNVAEGRGISVKGFLGNKNTNYEFSSSNPMWRATLEVLDFLPLANVDYSGGVITSDWYSSGEDYSLKITVRFLSNEIRSDSLKIIVHQKKCDLNFSCEVKLLQSKIQMELTESIVKKAAILEKELIKK